MLAYARGDFLDNEVQMGWFDNQETLSKADKSVKSKQSRKIEIKLPGSDEYVPISKFQYKRIYSDDIGPRLIIIIDEVAELLTPSGSKTQAAKEEDALKQEIISNIQSITQLGRTAGIHCILATQRNDANLIPGVIQNNSLRVGRTSIPVLRTYNSKE